VSVPVRNATFGGELGAKLEIVVDLAVQAADEPPSPVAIG
jgi:hypothetical protein